MNHTKQKVRPSAIPGAGFRLFANVIVGTALLLGAPAGWTAAPTITRQSGLHYYLVENKDSGQVVQRGTTGNAGVAFDRLILAPNTHYRIWVLQAATLLDGYVDITSPANGATLKLPQIRLGTDLSPDDDVDGLSNDAEYIMGTDPKQPDTDGDGILDGAEVKQGTDPLNGKAVKTGIVATAALPGTAVDICAINDIAVVANSDRGIAVFNVFNGMNPAIIAQVDTPGDARRVACSGNLIAVADGPSGLAIVDISDPPAAKIVRQLANLGESQSVAVADSLAMVGLRSGQIAVIDLISGAELARLNLTAPVEDIGFAGDYAFAITADKLWTLNVADGDFKVLGSVNSPYISTGAKRLFLGGGLAYVVHGKGYNTFDLTSPAQPRILGAGKTAQFGWKQIVPNGSGLGIAAVDQNLALDGPNDISIYNLSNATNTDVFILTFPTPGLARSLAIYNGLAYVADSPAGVQVVNYLAYDNKGKAPSISLKAGFPLDPARAEEGKLVWVEALVTDDVQVRNVEFYLDGQKIATDGNFPFEVRFTTPLRAGNKSGFTLRARASDTGGNAAWSTEYLVTLVPDASAPRIVKVQPALGSISGSVDTVVAYFSEPILESTITSASVKLVEAGPDQRLGNADDRVVTSGTLSYRGSANAVFLQFPANLPPGTYQAVVSSPAADRAGNALPNPFRWTFRVFDKVDTDRDGVPDEIEALLGLNQLNPDTNGNGIPDGDEDFDRDGLTNAQEIIMGTDPKNPHSVNALVLDGDLDRDGDSLSDSKELKLGTNPFLADSDGDGWNDESEVTAGSDPLDPGSRPTLWVTARPGVSLGLAGSLILQDTFILVSSRPPVSIGLPSLGDPLTLGVTVGRPPVLIGLPSLSATEPGVTVAGPPLSIGLPSLDQGTSGGLTIANPPLKAQFLKQ